MPDLSIVKSYDDGQTLTESMLDDIKNSIETWANTTKLDSTNIQTGGLATDNYAVGSVTLAKLASAVANALVPAGAVLAFGGTAAPSGYLMCDGSAVSRTTYADLFTAIGTAHGNGNGTTTFNVPDFRGRFLRGVDGGAANDPDRASRTAMASGGNTGDNVGSVQGHAFQTHNHTATDSGHTHSYSYPQAAGTAVTAGAGININGTSLTTGSGTANISVANASASGGTSQSSSNETRPVNAFTNFIIKT